jgi:D-glycero-alpha-D-manno-heptose 1-phosphate guanylyltransferase
MQILNFQEKKATEKGNINGGVYLLKRSSLESLNLPSRFSFEKDFMEAHIHDLKLMGIIQEGYFIDIGIPEDYLKAQTELPARL